MKKVLKSILVVFSLVSLVSCNEDDSKFSNDPQSGWVQQPQTEIIEVAFGTTNEVRVPIQLHSAINPGLDVSYAVEDVLGSSAGIITSIPGVFTIEEGELWGDIVLGLATEGLTSTIEVDVVLTATNRDNVQVGLSDNSKPIVRRVRICPFTFSTSYTGVPTAVLDPDVEADPFTVNFVQVDDYTFTLSTTWGPNYVNFLTGGQVPPGVFPYPSTFTLDPTTGIVTVTGNAGYALGGSGSMDACSGVITVTITDDLFAAFPTRVVFTPNPI